MRKKFLFLGLLFAFLVFAAVFFRVWEFIRPEVIKSYIEGYGVWVPVVYCLLYLVAVFIPHAGTAMTVVGGLLFAPFFGTFLVITVSSLGSVLPFLLAKRFARKSIQRWIEKTRYKKYLDRADENGFLFALYMRLVPLIPYELQNYILGLVDISTSRFILATFVGLLPGTFFLVYLGNTLTDIRPSKLIILGVISLFALLLPLVLKKYTRAKEILHEG